MKKKIKKKWIIWGIVGAVILLIVLRGCGRAGGAGYSEEKVEVRNIATFYSFSGNIDAKNKQNVTASTTAAIKEIYVSEGDYVRKGDILLSYDDDDVASSLASAQASVELARINYEKSQSAVSLTSAQTAFDDAQVNLERMSLLYESGAISKSQYEQAQTQYSNAKAQLDQAQLSYTTGMGSAKAQLDQANANLQNALNMQKNKRVEAKVDGVVADIYVQENSTLTMGQKILDVIDYNSLILDVDIDEYDLDAIQIGKSASVHINALNKDVGGTITKISNQAKKIGDLSYFTAEIELEPSEDLRVGLSVEVKVPRLERLGVATVSVSALKFDAQNKPFVYVGNKRAPVQKYVEIGANDGLVVEILEGLKEGDIVLVVQEKVNVQMGPQQGQPQVRQQGRQNESTQVE